MNDFNRNTRTLIVSFVVAIFALIPLRFVEVGQEMSLSQSENQVLGESIEVTPTTGQHKIFEEPYNELESNDSCISKAEMKTMEKLVTDKLLEGKLSTEDKSNMLNALKEQEMNVCK